MSLNQLLCLWAYLGTAVEQNAAASYDQTRADSPMSLEVRGDRTGKTWKTGALGPLPPVVADEDSAGGTAASVVAARHVDGIAEAVPPPRQLARGDVFIEGAPDELYDGLYAADAEEPAEAKKKKRRSREKRADEDEAARKERRAEARRAKKERAEAKKKAEEAEAAAPAREEPPTPPRLPPPPPFAACDDSC